MNIVDKELERITAEAIAADPDGPPWQLAAQEHEVARLIAIASELERHCEAMAANIAGMDHYLGDVEVSADLASWQKFKKERS